MPTLLDDLKKLLSGLDSWADGTQPRTGPHVDGGKVEHEILLAGTPVAGIPVETEIRAGSDAEVQDGDVGTLAEHTRADDVVADDDDDDEDDGDDDGDNSTPQWRG